MRLLWFPLLLLPLLPVGAQSAQGRPATSLGDRKAVTSELPGGTRDVHGVPESCAQEATPYVVLYVLNDEMILVVVVPRDGSPPLHRYPLGDRSFKPGLRVFLSL